MTIKQNLTIAVLVVLDALASYWVGQTSQSWLPPQAAAEAILVDDLFRFLVTIAAFIFFGIEGTLLYCYFAFSAAKGDFSDAEPVEGNIQLEIAWTVIPVVLVIWIGAYSFDVYRQMNILGPMQVVHLHLPAGVEPAYAATPEAGNPPDEVIEVEARQAAWSFRYPAASQVTSGELHLPAGKRVRLAMRSADVLHGFYVPDFRIKQDIIPGRTIDLSFTPIRPGRYRLYDSQFSGTYFATMTADVYVDTPQAYRQWLVRAGAGQVPAPVPPASKIAEPSKVLNSGWPTVGPSPRQPEGR